MNCPKDQTPLRERERETAGRDVVVMDICPTCGGIWLDQGELEKLSQAEGRYYEEAGRQSPRDDDDDDDDSHGGFGGRRESGRRERRGGFLGNLFEGFGD